MFTPIFVTLVAIFAYFVPESFAWVKGDVQTAILGLIMLAMGMTLTKNDFRVLASRPWEIAIGAAAQYTCMPLIAFSLAHVFQLPKEVAVGLILVGTCPGGVSSNLMSFLCKGDVAFSVGMTAASTLLAPLVTPILMLYLAGQSVEVDALGMFKSILIVTIIPVAIGFALNAAFGEKRAFEKVKKALPLIAVLALGAIVGAVVSAHGASIMKSGLIIFAAVLCHNFLGYASGFALGKLSKFSGAKCRTLSLEVGMQNAGLATVLAARHFPLMPEVAIASALSCVWHSISGALVAGFFSLRLKFSK